MHNRTGKESTDAHPKRNVTGSVARDGAPSEAVVVAVTNGRLDGSTELAEVFRTWARILCQLDGWPESLDGRRRKRVLVKIIGE